MVDNRVAHAKKNLAECEESHTAGRGVLLISPAMMQRILRWLSRATGIGYRPVPPICETQSYQEIDRLIGKGV